MKVTLPSWKKQSINYLKSHSKGSLVAGGPIFVAAVIFTIFAVSQIFAPINNYLDSGAPWDITFNEMLASTLLNTTLLVPAIMLFIAAYLQAESHSLGCKISLVLSVAFLFGTIFNLSNIYVLLFSMILCIISTMAGFAEREKIQGKKDTAIVTENVARFGLRLSGILCVATLFGLMAYVAVRGAQFINWNFLTGSTLDYTSIGRRVVGLEAGSIGGIRDFILGGLLCVGLCEVIAIPLGLGAAIFLSEYAPDNRFISTLRFFIETLAGAPSVILGLFGFTFFVQLAGMHYSLPAAALSLAFMILPWNIRVAEEAMRAVPKAYREASYALGATKWQTIKRTVLLPASPGAITGVLLGVGAAFGETAVLIFTAGGLGVTTLPNPISITGGQGQAIPVLAVWILGAYRNIHANGPGITKSLVWQESNVAYSAALVLLLIFLAISISALILRNYLAKKTRGA